MGMCGLRAIQVYTHVILQGALDLPAFIFKCLDRMVQKGKEAQAAAKPPAEGPVGKAVAKPPAEGPVGVLPDG